MPPLLAAIPAIGAQLAAGTALLPALSVGLAAPGMAGLGATAAMGAGSMGLNAFGAKQAEVAQNRAAREAQQTWKENAFPSQDEINAAKGQIGQETAAAQRDLPAMWASRGWGAGTGQMNKQAWDLQKAGMQNKARVETNALTPRYAFPQQGYSQPTLSPWGTMAQSGGSMLGTGAGLYAAGNIYKSLFGNVKEKV